MIKPPLSSPSLRHAAGKRGRFLPALTAALMLLGLSPADAADAVGRLAIRGAGATPNANVMLAVPGATTLTAKATSAGDFSFVPIPYDFMSPLDLRFTVPVSDLQKAPLKPNVFSVMLDPGAFVVTAQGYATKASSIALNVGGEAAAAGVAGSTAYFRVDSPPRTDAIQPDNTKIIASIINVKEACCPRSFEPAQPLMIYMENAKGSGVALPGARPVAAPIPIPGLPAQARPETPAEKPLPKGMRKPGTGVSPAYPQGRPDPAAAEEESGELSVNRIEQVVSISAAPLAYAAGFTPTESWAQGLRNITDHLGQSTQLQARMLGGFIDAQQHLEAQRVLQRLTAKAYKDYTPGEALCQFGTLTRSVAASEARGIATKQTLNTLLRDRETQRKGSSYGTSPGDGLGLRLAMFMNTYCDMTDEGGALGSNNGGTGMVAICAKLPVDKNFNRDVDYTRTLDNPLTLGVNFTSAPSADEIIANGSVVELMSNLIASQPAEGFGADDFSAGKVLSDDLQSYRTVVAARGVARNSFTTLIGQKAAGTAASAQYMKKVLQNMGMDANAATSLIGTNPSYFAQMEVLTKKIYQDPAFFVNLYDKPTNVERQRAAMRAINLQQQNDVLNVLQRREMLLSTLLELKLRNP